MRYLRLVTAALCAFLAPVARADVTLTKDVTRHAVVPAFVNGRGPYQFILDTGADESAVYAWFAKSLHLPKGKARTLSGATGSESMIGARLSTLRVDGRTIKDIDADTMPDRPDGAKIAGIVGVDLMAHRLAILDFGCGTFALRPLDRPDANAGANAHFIKAGSIPSGKQLTLPVTINGAAGVALLDTGARDSIVNTAFVHAAGVDFQSFHDSVPTRGAAGITVNAGRGRIGNVRFAGITRANATARVADISALQGLGVSGDRAMILGLDFLAGTRLTVDYSNRRFWIARSKCQTH